MGCFSLYGVSSAETLMSNTRRLPLDMVNSSLQGFLRSHQEAARIKAIEQSFDEEFARSVTSLAVLGIIHDVSGAARTLTEIIKERLPTQLVGMRLTPDAEAALDEAAVAITKLLAITTHMKAIAKDRPTGKSRVKIDGLVTELEPLLQSQVKSTSDSRVTLKYAPAPSIRGYSYEVLADSVKLERVVLNLVDNAGYWAAQSNKGSGLVVLTVSPASIEEQGATGVLIAVEDNGPGIDPEARPQIFSRFFTTRKGSGTGLGLYLVQRFVSEMGGTIEVSSHPGRTVFSVIIPSYQDSDRGYSS